MGVHKHNSNSAKAKQCAKYKSEGRREKSKALIQEKLRQGKKIKSRRVKKTKDMLWDIAIQNAKPIGVELKKKTKKRKVKEEE